MVLTVIQQPTLRGIDLPDGDYVLRLRGIDDLALEGLHADHAFALNARPASPVLLEPLDDAAVIHEARPTFQWSTQARVAAYHVQVASDPGFQDTKIEALDHKGTRLQPDWALSRGRYYWRIPSRHLDGDEGPFGDPRSFRLQWLPVSPRLFPPVIEEQQLRFSWQPVTAAARFQFQMASNDEFFDLVEERIVDDARITVPRPLSDVYYYRVRGLAVDGVAEPYSAVHSVEIPPPRYWPVLLFLFPTLLLLLLF